MLYQIPNQIQVLFARNSQMHDGVLLGSQDVPVFGIQVVEFALNQTHLFKLIQAFKTVLFERVIQKGLKNLLRGISLDKFLHKSMCLEPGLFNKIGPHINIFDRLSKQGPFFVVEYIIVYINRHLSVVCIIYQNDMQPICVRVSEYNLVNGAGVICKETQEDSEILHDFVINFDVVCIRVIHVNYLIRLISLLVVQELIGPQVDGLDLALFIGFR